jgi:hypothetical protein
MPRFLMVILMMGLAGVAWLQPEEDDPAAKAIEAYIDAFFAADYETAQTLLCADDLENLDQDAFEQAVKTSLGNSIEAGSAVDLSNLAYDALELGEALAEVMVTGEILAGDQLQPVEIDLRAIGLDSVWAVYEDESWKACSQVPPDQLDDLGPDVITRLFMDASFKGYYDQAHALVCEAQYDTLSQAEFDQIYGPLLADEVRFNFHNTLFEITEQTESSAVVTISGEVVMTVGERPSPIPISAETMGLSAVQLRYEDGWKICSSQPG